MNLFKNVDESWIPLLHSLAYKEPLVTFLANLNETSFQPGFSEIFRVFEMPVDEIKVVILGQEPYPIPGAANGVAYGVKENSLMPKILKNIEKELYTTEGIRVQNDDNDIVDQSWKTLRHWTDQGVFLLNGALTVETGNSGSHALYWREFTEAVVSYISTQKPCIWGLWGRYPLSYYLKIKNSITVKKYDRETIKEIPIDNDLNYIVPGHHPIVMEFEDTKNFSGDGFYLMNEILKKKNLKQIIW